MLYNSSSDVTRLFRINLLGQQVAEFFSIFLISVYLNKESSLVLLICIRIYYIRFDINIQENLQVKFRIQKNSSILCAFFHSALTSMGSRCISK